jgi:hypothetical protein
VHGSNRLWDAVRSATDQLQTEDASRNGIGRNTGVEYDVEMLIRSGGNEGYVEKTIALIAL